MNDGLKSSLIFDEYQNFGFYLAKGLLSYGDFSKLEKKVTETIGRYYSQISSLNEMRWVEYAVSHPECVAKIYDELRDSDELISIGKNSKITEIVHQLIREPALYKKVPFRIDVPFETKELAFWHQDDFYVKGNDDEVTLWIPLFDTNIQQGPLQVMPCTHKHGRVPHNLKVGKKLLPADIYENDIRYVEMKKGDVLFFSSLLLHSSSLNISNQIRYSIQLRYTSQLKSISNEMKGVCRV